MGKTYSKVTIDPIEIGRRQMRCFNYAELSFLPGPHCYNCMKRDGFPWRARAGKGCKNYERYVKEAKR